MEKITLNGKWIMRELSSEEWVEANVPGTVFSDLFNAGLVNNPYYGNNEDKIQDVFNHDYEYQRSFNVEKSVLDKDRINLICQGIDTLAEIYINKILILNANNMHRTYKVDIKNVLQSGMNEINIIFKSPRKYIEDMSFKSKLPSVLGNDGVEFIRKAQCSFGWDWGLSLPDLGIWRDIYIESKNVVEIKDSYVKQTHKINCVDLNITCDINRFKDVDLVVETSVKKPSGDILVKNEVMIAGNDKYNVEFRIDNPELWWPNGYGEQPLYEVEIKIFDNGILCDSTIKKIGLRTINLRREKDQWGKSYEFVVNEKSIFIKGSNMIIEDSILSRYSNSRTTQLLEDSIKANFNCIRVWGGAIYPNEHFYEECDRLGLIVYQDLMFACHAYPIDINFLETVKAEIEDNVKRIRNHPCLGLWCGNNEVEIIIEMFTDSDEPLFKPIREYFKCELNKKEESVVKEEYRFLFDEFIPNLICNLDPETDYVRASPFNDIIFERNEDTSDSHYYLAFDGMKPFRLTQRSHYFRFVSEMGFQSYPNIKTIRSFCEKKDQKPDSEIMYKHQKATNGNQTIEAYMKDEFVVPSDFSEYVFISQILAGEIMKYAVEHMRRNRNRCMGIITWQLNDCWPTVSWSGIDYYGRWKAQQYYSKRFYEPILISGQEDENSISIYVTNDKLETLEGVIRWSILNNKSDIIVQGTEKIIVSELTSKDCIVMDIKEIYKEFDPKQHYMEYVLTNMDNSNVINRGVTLFVPTKDFELRPADISIEVVDLETEFLLLVESNVFTKSIYIDFEDLDVIFSDNFFDLSANTIKEVRICKNSIASDVDSIEIKKQINILCVNNIR